MSTLIQRNFAGGEITPSIHARVDTVKYQTGLSTMRNFLIPVAGGAENRPGTENIGRVRDSAAESRLIPFVFSQTQTYVLEACTSDAGVATFRFIQNGQYLYEASNTFTAITNTSPLVLTYTAITDQLFTGDWVYISGVGGITHINNRTFVVERITGTTIKLKDFNGNYINTISPAGYTSGGTYKRVYTLDMNVTASPPLGSPVVYTTFNQQSLRDLKYVQSADVMTFVDGKNYPFTLKRLGQTNWFMSLMGTTPLQLPPTSASFSDSLFSGEKWAYIITAVSSSGEESLQGITATKTNSAFPTAANPHGITFTAAAGAVYYNIYAVRQNAIGFVGTVTTSGTDTYVNRGTPPDYTITPPIANLSMAIATVPGDNTFKPRAIGYFQQRLGVASSDIAPQQVDLSATGFYTNFSSSRPPRDASAIQFNLIGNKVSQIKHMIDLGGLVIFTDASEHVVNQDGSPIAPSNISVRKTSNNGSSDLAPIIIDNTALYVQARGNIVRNLFFEFSSDGYKGTNMSIFASHLFKGHTIVDWTYQDVPNSIIWAVRDDGVLLGLTYIPEQQIWGWHRHDTDGLVKRVTCIPEGSESALYLIVERVINGDTIRFTERMKSRTFTDTTDAFFVDGGSTFDGRNTNLAHTMTISGGSTWASDELLTVTSSIAFFSIAELGNEIHFTLADGSTLRFHIDNYTSTTVITGRPSKTVPVTSRSVATSKWARAVDQLTGLYQLEGKAVSVFAGGYVVASPLNSSYGTVTVSAATITLNECYPVIHVGLPYISDLVTLDIDSAQSETFSDKKMLINKVSMHVESAYPMYVGTELPKGSDVLDGLFEQKLEDLEDYEGPPPLKTGTIDAAISGTFNNNGRVSVRQIDPVPVSILAISPTGKFPTGGK